MSKVRCSFIPPPFVCFIITGIMKYTNSYCSKINKIKNLAISLLHHGEFVLKSQGGKTTFPCRVVHKDGQQMAVQTNDKSPDSRPGSTSHCPEDTSWI